MSTGRVLHLMLRTYPDINYACFSDGSYYPADIIPCDGPFSYDFGEETFTSEDDIIFVARDFSIYNEVSKHAITDPDGGVVVCLTHPRRLGQREWQLTAIQLIESRVGAKSKIVMYSDREKLDEVVNYFVVRGWARSGTTRIRIKSEDGRSCVFNPLPIHEVVGQKNTVRKLEEEVAALRKVVEQDDKSLRVPLKRVLLCMEDCLVMEREGLKEMLEVWKDL